MIFSTLKLKKDLSGGDETVSAQGLEQIDELGRADEGINQGDFEGPISFEAPFAKQFDSSSVRNAPCGPTGA